MTGLIRLSKKAYYQEYFTTNLAKQKKTWEGINKLINRKRKIGRPIAALKCPVSERVSRNPSEISNILNKHFSRIVHKLATKMPMSTISFYNYLPSFQCPKSFAFQPVSPSEIEAEFMSIPANKAHGLYSCPIYILAFCLSLYQI